MQDYSPGGEEENQIDRSRVGRVSSKREGIARLREYQAEHYVLPIRSEHPPSHAPLPPLGEGSARTQVHWRENKNLRKHGCITVVDHVPKSSATIETVKTSPDQIHIDFALWHFLLCRRIMFQAWWRQHLMKRVTLKTRWK